MHTDSCCCITGWWAKVGRDDAPTNRRGNACGAVETSTHSTQCASSTCPTHHKHKPEPTPWSRDQFFLSMAHAPPDFFAPYDARDSSELVSEYTLAGFTGPVPDADPSSSLPSPEKDRDRDPPRLDPFDSMRSRPSFALDTAASFNLASMGDPPTATAGSNNGCEFALRFFRFMSCALWWSTTWTWRGCAAWLR